jgi:ATP-dependent DNA ligase
MRSFNCHPSRSHRRCRTSWSDPGGRWPHRLVATTAEERLNIWHSADVVWSHSSSHPPRGFQPQPPLPIYAHIMLARPRTLPTGFIAPCLPTKVHTLPSGGLGPHEIKHDGFRIIARKDGERVKLYSRSGNDLTRRFPLIVETLARLRSRSCIIGGEAVACDDNGVALFDPIRHHRANESILLYAFDLIELNGDDLRRDPLEVRKATLASIVAKAAPASGSMSISRVTARPSSPMPARWVLRASSRSARTVLGVAAMVPWCWSLRG